MNYKLINTNNLYSVLETQTEQIIKSFKDQSEAKRFMRHLNFGGGFDSWTPTFFLNSVSEKLFSRINNNRSDM